MPNSAHAAGRHFRRRYPDMFTEGGTVHPIRNSPGYDALEERAATISRERRQGEGRAREEAREEEAREGDREQALEDWRKLRRMLERAHGISRDPVQGGAGARVRRSYDHADIPGGFGRAGHLRGGVIQRRGIAPDALPEGLAELGLSDLSAAQAEDMDGEEALAYIRRKHRQYEAASGRRSDAAEARLAGQAVRRRQRALSSRR